MQRPKKMRAMVLEAAQESLRRKAVPVPSPAVGEVLMNVRACGVCRTDLHIVDGELPEPKLPLVPGHQVVGEVVATGEGVERFAVGDRVGVPWLGQTCGACDFCAAGQENLCDHARFTGYSRDGGYAEYMTAHQHFAFPLPAGYRDVEVAPLLCAGLIGFRSYRMTGERVERLGLYGFGSAAHIIAQVAIFQHKQVYAFTRPGDTEGQAFARELGAVWAGGSTELPPDPLDAAILFAPVGKLVPAALAATRKGGVVVCGGIHMSDIPAFPYRLLWEERVVRSVANLTRKDAEWFLRLAGEMHIQTHVTRFPLEQANEALDRLRSGQLTGSAVLQVEEASS